MPRKIAMKAVKGSSHIASIGYSAATKTLSVSYAGGATYHYPGVTKDEHKDLMAAESKGRFIQAHIRSKGGVKQSAPKGKT